MASSIRVTSSRLPELAAAVEAELATAVMHVATAAGEWMFEELNGPKTGRIYGAHQASAPGETPATDTGLLESSITTEMVGPTSAQVSTNTAYSAALELGTSKIAPRPLIAPAAVAMEPVAEAELQAAVVRAVGGTP